MNNIKMVTKERMSETKGKGWDLEQHVSQGGGATKREEGECSSGGEEEDSSPCSNPPVPATDEPVHQHHPWRILKALDGDLDKVPTPSFPVGKSTSTESPSVQLLHTWTTGIQSFLKVHGSIQDSSSNYTCSLSLSPPSSQSSPPPLQSHNVSIPERGLSAQNQESSESFVASDESTSDKTSIPTQQNQVLSEKEILLRLNMSWYYVGYYQALLEQTRSQLPREARLDHTIISQDTRIHDMRRNNETKRGGIELSRASPQTGLVEESANIQDKIKSNSSSHDGSGVVQGDDNEDASDADERDADEAASTEILTKEPQSIIMGIISQLASGSDLHRISLPTFVLEPRSMCERLADFLSHPHLLLAAPAKTTPLERFMEVVRFYISGFHIRPKGVKKPFNPVLGEFYRCSFLHPDHSRSYYVCEQVSHHPPMSVYHFYNPKHGIRIDGDIRPKAKFLGNSAATLMKGGTTITFRAHPEEVYHLTFPNVYARGILFGKLLMELGDTGMITCPSSKLSCTIDFKTKGFFTPHLLNHIQGRVFREIDTPKSGSLSSQVLHTLSGKWTRKVYMDEGQLFFDATTCPRLAKTPRPRDNLEEFESVRLWENVARGLAQKDLNTATLAKVAIEQNQRELIKHRGSFKKNRPWSSRFFKLEEEEKELSESRSLQKWTMVPVPGLHLLEEKMRMANSGGNISAKNEEDEGGVESAKEASQLELISQMEALYEDHVLNGKPVHLSHETFWISAGIDSTASTFPPNAKP